MPTPELLVTVGGLLGLLLLVAPLVTERCSLRIFGARVRGFRRVLDGDEPAARREFARRLGVPPAAMMATMLPFAIVFDLDKSWMSAFLT